MELRAKNLRRRPRLFRANLACLRGRHFRAAAVAAGEVEIVDFPAARAQAQERAGHVKLNVVRVRRDGDGRGLGHGSANLHGLAGGGGLVGGKDDLVALGGFLEARVRHFLARAQ